MRNIQVEFGINVKNLRTKKKWTQDKLAEQANLQTNYIGEIERGEVNVSLRTIEKIAVAFSIEPAELLRFE